MVERWEERCEKEGKETGETGETRSPPHRQSRVEKTVDAFTGAERGRHAAFLRLTTADKPARQP